MVRTERLSKRFGRQVALEPIDLVVERGEIFGLLGHNGAGKSTTLGLLLGQLHPSGGEAFIDGQSVQRNRAAALRHVGAIYEAPAFYDYLSGWDNLSIFASYTAKPSRARQQEIVELVGLSSGIRDRVKTYSHGMRQRLALAQALLPDPRLVILDEPNDGLDPHGIAEVRNLIFRLRDEFGLTVVLSSHLLSEVELLCDRVAILDHGKMVFCGAWRSFKPETVQVRIRAEDWRETASWFRAKGAMVHGDGLVCIPSPTNLAELLSEAIRAGCRISEFSPVPLTLEHFYFDRTRGR